MGRRPRSRTLVLAGKNKLLALRSANVMGRRGEKEQLWRASSASKSRKRHPKRTLHSTHAKPNDLMRFRFVGSRDRREGAKSGRADC